MADEAGVRAFTKKAGMMTPMKTTPRMTKMILKMTKQST
jgi:hypothetical protein